MVLVKTPAGQEALKDRHGSLSSRQRSAFILFDGKRSTAQILAATAAMGITQADVQAMIDQGLLVSLSGQPPATASAAGGADAPAADSEAGESVRSAIDRYKDAYPIATSLTAELGLRGFRLNLAVEGAGGFSDLSALAPKIREAVGDAKFARLEKALFG